MLPLANLAALFSSAMSSSTVNCSPFIKNGERFDIFSNARYLPSDGALIVLAFGDIGRDVGFNFLEKKSLNDVNSSIFFSNESFLMPYFSMNGTIFFLLNELDASLPSIIENILRFISSATPSLPITVV